MKKKKDRAEQPDLEKMEISGEEEDESVTAEEEVAVAEENLEQEYSLEEQNAFLQSSLDELTAKAEEYLDGWQRARAEFANYKKRVLKENTGIHQVARGEVVKIFLDVLDDLERALDDKPAQGDGQTWGDGIELIVQKLHNRLDAEGVTPMKALGEEFDPNIHEALMKEESDEYESGMIIEVMQKGYWIGEKVLRPALVRVAA